MITRSIRRMVVMLSILLLGVIQVHAAGHTSHPACGTSCSHDTAHTTLEATSWTSGYVLSGDRYLTSNLTLSRNIVVSGTARLCLNGNTLTFNEGYGLTLETGGSLELCDCKGTGGIVRGTRISNSDSSIINNFGTLTIYGGQYCTNGEGVCLNNQDGTLTIYGGIFGIELSNCGTAVIYDADFNIEKPNYSPYPGAIDNDSGCSLTIYDGTFQAYGYALHNQGTATIRGGTFRCLRDDNFGGDCIGNSGLMYLHDGDISAVKGDGISNDDDGSRLYIYGGKITAPATYRAAVYTRGMLEMTDGTLNGYIGIDNQSIWALSNKDGGTCEVTGGTIRGTLCGIRNGGNGSFSNGAQYVSRSKLVISSSPTISKIILEYPDAFEFHYYGTDPIPLELILDEWNVGDMVWSVNRSKVHLMDLQNEGYVLQNNGSGVILNNNHCGANGDNLRWKLSKDGVLTIWGTGDMEDFWVSANPPWTYNKTGIYVKKVVVEEGVTSLGKAAFSGLDRLTAVQLPESLRKIGSWAFEWTDALQSVKLPAGLQTIERNIFNERKTVPEEILYDGCRHQWAKINVDSSQAVWVQPTFLPNTNKDDGTCLTELLCSVCGEADVPAREEHTGGTATCTTLAECEVCGTAYGDYGHVFEQQVLEEVYLKERETCETSAVYYFSCACGARGTETFAGPEPRGHVFDQEVAHEDYLLYEGTCTEGGYYFKSCICGLAGDSDVFESTPLGHVFTDYADNGDGTETAPCIRACNETDTRYRTFAQLFPDAGFRAYVTETVLVGNTDDMSDDAHLTAAQLASIRAHTTIILDNRSDITSLQGIELFSGLTSLTCAETAITELNLSHNMALTSLNCSGNALTALDVSKNTALKTLNCSECGLLALDVSANTVLEMLDCHGNALTALHVSKNPALVSLHCNDNELAALDVSANTALETLNCSNNVITALDVSANAALSALDCSKNALTILDLSGNAALMPRYCVLDGQTPTKTTPVVEDTGRGWTFNLTAFLGENGDLSRVTMTDGGSLKNGIVTYPRKPVQVTYCYDVGVGNVPLDITWTAVHGPAHVHIYNCENTDPTYLVSPASCTAAALYYKSCICGKATDETFSYGEPLEHTYDQQSTEHRYLASPASCTEAALYYFSCACGAQGEETFVYGEPLQHTYDQLNTDETYLKTPATCTRAAFYYKSCVCGKAGTGIFVSGEMLGHDHGYAWENGTLVYECSRCGSGRTLYLTVSADTAMTLTAEGNVPAGMAVYAAAYNSIGRMTALELVTDGSALSFAGAHEVRIFVLDAFFTPIVQSLRLSAATE